MNKQEQIQARQLMLRAQNNPTSCSNEELAIPLRDESSVCEISGNTKSTMSLVLQDIQDYLELGAWNALRVA